MCTVGQATNLALLFGLTLAVSSLVPASSCARDRAPVPTDAAQAKALELVKEVYGETWAAARSTDQKTALARKLLADADQTTDAANGYALLEVAREMCTQAGDAELAFKAIDAMNTRYAVDAFKLKNLALSQATKSAKSQSQFRAVAECAFALLDLAIETDDFVAAKSLGELALQTARKSRDLALVKRIIARDEEVKKTAQAYASVRDAAMRLKENPVDPEANLAVGKYRCFFKGDWERGLPMLVLGSDEQLKKLAVMELGGLTDGEEQLAVGDGWWELAETGDSVVAQQLRRRAAHWYSRVLPELTGLVKGKVEKRLKALSGAVGLSADTHGGRPNVGMLHPSRRPRPTLRPLNELNTDYIDAYPWVSPDGLDLYWTREGTGQPAVICHASRSSSAEPFGESQPLIAGRLCALTEDGLEIVFLHDELLCNSTRSAKNKPFSETRIISGLRSQPKVKSPWLSSDGLMLVFQRSSREGMTEFVSCTRRSRRDHWGSPRIIPIRRPQMQGRMLLTWPFLTGDGLSLLCCCGGHTWAQIILGTRRSPNLPFSSFRVVAHSGNPLRGRSPRYVEATQELFFCAVPEEGSQKWDLWVLKNVSLEDL